MFEGITKYIPYSLVAPNALDSRNVFGVPKEKYSFLNTYSTQIRYLQNENAANAHNETNEKLFTDWEYARDRSRIIFTNTPFYCSANNDTCQGNSNTNRKNYEDTIVENDVVLVISGFGPDYERTFPVQNQQFERVDNEYNFASVKSKPTYITINGPVEGDGVSQKPWITHKSPEPSFGVLKIESNTEIVYEELNSKYGSVDYFKLKLQKHEEELGKLRGSGVSGFRLVIANLNLLM